MSCFLGGILGDLFVTLTLVLSHQGRGDSVGCVGLFTLTFDSSPIKGEGMEVVLSWCLPCPVVSRLRGNDGPG